MIFLSAGHHNADPGAIANGYREADLTKELRDLIVIELKNRGKVQGVDFIIDDDKETLSQYLKRIKPGNGSVVFEIHFDAASPTATGCTMLIPAREWTKEYLLEMQFGQDITNVTSKTLGIKNRGVMDETKSHRGKLGIMRPAGINGLLEVCFLTNKGDLDKYLEKSKLLAGSIAEILIRYDTFR